MKRLVLLNILVGIAVCGRGDLKDPAKVEVSTNVVAMLDRLDFNETYMMNLEGDLSSPGYSVPQHADWTVEAVRPILRGEYARQQEQVDHWLSDLLSGGSRNELPRTMLSNMGNHWFTNYHSEFVEGRGYHWMLELTGKIRYCSTNYLSYVTEINEFEGGLRPNRDCRGGVWSFQKQRPLTWDDFFETNQTENVLQLVRDPLVLDIDHYGDTSYAMFTNGYPENVINQLPKALVVNENGISFIYCPSDNPLAFRRVVGEVLVPWQELQPFFKEGVVIPPSRPEKGGEARTEKIKTSTPRETEG